MTTNRKPRMDAETAARAEAAGLAIGDRVTANVGGVVRSLTIGAFTSNSTQGLAFRSTTPTDHIHTQLWISVGCLIKVEQ